MTAETTIEIGIEIEARSDTINIAMIMLQRNDNALNSKVSFLRDPLSTPAIRLHTSKR